MSQDIDQWLFATLNGDPTLQGLWSKPTENPYQWVAAQTRTIPYTVFRFVARPVEPTLQDPTGALSNWVYSFQTWAFTPKVAKQITQRILNVLLDNVQVSGVESIYEVLRVPQVDVTQNAVALTLDVFISEKLCG